MHLASLPVSIASITLKLYGPTRTFILSNVNIDSYAHYIRFHMNMNGMDLALPNKTFGKIPESENSFKWVI